nr:ESPR-type extended signal peptide-containing protein [uncultured Veillonella sp.]
MNKIFKVVWSKSKNVT